MVPAGNKIKRVGQPQHKTIYHHHQNGEILSSNANIADTFNDYFSNVVQNLNIPRENSMLNTDLCINPLLAIVEKYKHHQSIISINKKNERKRPAKI